MASDAIQARGRGFIRELGLLDSTMIVAGSMIGSGIFIVSADIARDVGSPGGLLLTWILTGMLTVAAALSYGELAAMMPHAGGQYIYLREAYSRPTSAACGRCDRRPRSGPTSRSCPRSRRRRALGGC